MDQRRPDESADTAHQPRGPQQTPHEQAAADERRDHSLLVTDVPEILLRPFFLPPEILFIRAVAFTPAQ
jgi:hypothetical protein